MYIITVCIGNGNNRVIFDKLGIEIGERADFCSKYYGYKAGHHGAWPTCKSGDYEALSRLIHALQELCDKHNGKFTQEIKVGDWVKCISNDYTYAKNYIIGKKYQILEIDLKNVIQKHLIKAEFGSDYWQEIPGNCFIPCETNEVTTEQVKVGDYVKCISHSDQWSKKFSIGNTYRVQAISQDSYSVADSRNILLWVPKQDFILCNDEVQDDLEWKVGDKIQYVREADYRYGLNDCTVGNTYTIIRRNSKLNHPIIIDDVDDEVSLSKEERDCFKKINNQTTQLNYHVKSNSNNSFELPSSSPAISARQTPRGGIVSSSDLEVWI